MNKTKKMGGFALDPIKSDTKTILKAYKSPL
jgi:hypothetical protein